MSKPTWWTCGCGAKNCTWPHQRLECAACGKAATFDRAVPDAQAPLFPRGDEERVG